MPFRAPGCHVLAVDVETRESSGLSTTSPGPKRTGAESAGIVANVLQLWKLFHRGRTYVPIPNRSTLTINLEMAKMNLSQIGNQSNARSRKFRDSSRRFVTPWAGNIG